ncbi:MAG: toll/interleukin-1 receptor domain-containing protein [Nitrospirota bacterium]
MEKISPKDRVEKLLQSLIKQTSHVGAPVEFSAQWDYPLATAHNSQEAMFHVGELKKKGLIEFFNMTHLLVTHDGWAHGNPAPLPMASPSKSDDESTTGKKEWDVFICHASEDKTEVVEPLAVALKGEGFAVWYDRSELTIGDSLRQKIDDGLIKSRFGIVVISPKFFAKKWPGLELDGLVQKEISGEKVILPVWHNVSHADVSRYSLPLAGKVAGSTSQGIPPLVQELIRAIRSTANATGGAVLSAQMEPNAKHPVLPANLEPDTTMFRKLDHMASEKTVRELLNQKIYTKQFRLEDDHFLVDLIDEFQRIENCYLDDELRKESEKLVKKLVALLNIVRRTFFSVGDGRLKFYPDPIDSKHYDAEWTELVKAIDSAWTEYKTYRMTVKERLRV